MIIALSGQYAPDLRMHLSRHHEIVELDMVLYTAQAAEVDLLITRGGLRVDRALLNRLPKLQKIVKAGSGLDTIDVATARKRGVDVVATGGSAESVADLALALLLSCLRSVPLLDSAVRRGEWQQKALVIGNTLASRRIGIVGFGQIGRQFAAKCIALGAEVRAWDRSIKSEPKGTLLASMSIKQCQSLGSLIQYSDVVSLHLPLNIDTTSLIGRNEFMSMRTGTILINTSRADIVERKALLVALSDGTLASAGLDVHYNEGQETAEPLFDRPNVVLTPHVGAQTEQARQEIAERIISEVNGSVRPATDPFPVATPGIRLPR